MIKYMFKEVSEEKCINFYSDVTLRFSVKMNEGGVSYDVALLPSTSLICQ